MKPIVAASPFGLNARELFIARKLAFPLGSRKSMEATKHQKVAVQPFTANQIRSLRVESWLSFGSEGIALQKGKFYRCDAKGNAKKELATIEGKYKQVLISGPKSAFVLRGERLDRLTGENLENVSCMANNRQEALELWDDLTGIEDERKIPGNNCYGVVVEDELHIYRNSELEPICIEAPHNIKKATQIYLGQKGLLIVVTRKGHTSYKLSHERTD